MRGIFSDGGVAVNPLEEKGVKSLRRDSFESLRTTQDRFEISDFSQKVGPHERNW